MSDLLKNAVADAKMVKDTALANAQLVLAEAFTPQLQSMLSKKLQSEIEDAEDDEFDVDGGEDFEDETNSDDLDETKAEDGEVVSEDENLDEEDASAVNEMDDEEDFEDFEDEEEVEDDGLDLDEIIAELEAYLESDNEDEDEVEGEVDLDGDGDVDVAFDDEGGEDEVDFEDEEDEEEFDLDEILKALEEMEQGEEEDEKEVELENLRTENKKLQKDLKEHRDVVVFLRGKINEVNLLNAKLLYSNRLFRAFNMDNDQKKRVLEALDRTKDVREVKLVYATLAENMSHGSVSKRTTVTEGLASKTVKSTKPTKTVIEESVEITDAEKTFTRLQELAFKKRR